MTELGGKVCAQFFRGFLPHFNIVVGFAEYWSGLLSSTDFTGQKLLECLNTIHGDIIAVWNIRDPQNYLASDNFKALMSNLVKDLADVSTTNSTTQGSGQILTGATALASVGTSIFGIVVGSIGAGVAFAKWVYDVYNHTHPNVCCVMGYIVDLTIVMNGLFLRTRDASEEHIVSVLGAYCESGNLGRVHNAIRRFVDNTEGWRLVNQEYVLHEIIRLINEYCAVSSTPNETAHKPSDTTQQLPFETATGRDTNREQVAERDGISAQPTNANTAVRQRAGTPPQRSSKTQNIQNRGTRGIESPGAPDVTTPVHVTEGPEIVENGCQCALQ
jgi:hypothetical protein